MEAFSFFQLLVDVSFKKKKRLLGDVGLSRKKTIGGRGRWYFYGAEPSMYVTFHFLSWPYILQSKGIINFNDVD